MEAGLAVNRFPARAVAVLATLFAGLAIGGSLGYTIKPQEVVVTHPISTVGQAAPAPISDTCIFVNHHKGC
jgi:hypothetical protein